MKLRLYAVLMSVAALGLAIALFREQSAARELADRVTKLSRANAELRYQFKQTARQAAEVGQRAVELDAQLGSTKVRSTATEVKQVQLTRELTETRSRLTDREQREVALMAELATLREQQPAADVAAADRRISELEQQLTQLLTRALTEAVDPADSAPVPATPSGHRVVRVGPRDAFVVLDYGTEHGARPSDILLLRRGTSDLARVQISEARPRFALAQVLPGTLKGQLQSGDLVVLKN